MNSMYKGTNRYNIVTIDADPDSTIYMRILEHFPMCSFDRSYVSDNMNHNSLTLSLLKRRTTYMSKLVWDQTGERYYETGVKMGVLIPQ